MASTGFNINRDKSKSFSSGKLALIFILFSFLLFLLPGMAYTFPVTNMALTSDSTQNQENIYKSDLEEIKSLSVSNNVFYKIESRTTFTNGEYTPFWFTSNQYGLGTPVLNNGYIRGQILNPLESENKLSWGAGVDLVGGWNQPAVFRVQQLYGEFKYRRFWMSLGSREYIAPYNDRLLSSGDLLFSGNALPIPQFRIGTFDFAPFWGTKGWFSVKAYLSYGMFTDSNWEKHWVAKNFERTSDVLFCGRGLWFRIGNKEKFPLTVDMGIEMGTQFGGTIYKPNSQEIKMPTSFINWLKALVPTAGGASTPISEQTNVEGNMTGEYDFSVSYALNQEWKFRFYLEHYFEDHSQMFLEYGFWKDGLLGIEVEFPKNPFLSKFVYEYVCTKDQTGAVNHDYTPEIPEQVSGSDNYFNHHLYGSWQTWGMMIGTPLAISPLYNTNHRIYIYNTRFIANHFGLKGNPVKDLTWRFLLTFSRNWGTYRYPFPEVYNNCSGLLELYYSPSLLKGLFVKGAIAWDHGKLLGNNFGGMFSIGFAGDFSIHRK